MDKVLPELMKPIRAFAAVDIGKSRGYEGIRKGEIPYTLVAGQIRIPRSWVEQKIREALAGTSVMSDGTHDE
jgi:hypothetical protein